MVQCGRGLVVYYENLHENFDDELEKIVSFLDVECSATKRTVAVCATYRFMSHTHKVFSFPFPFFPFFFVAE